LRSWSNAAIQENSGSSFAQQSGVNCISKGSGSNSGVQFFIKVVRA
jgi:hypothetical protein